MKNRKSSVLWLSVFIVGLLTLGSLGFTLKTYAAGPPSILSYQGRLTNASGSLLGGSSGTTYYFKFSLWSAVTSGTKLWPTSDPTSYGVTVREGVFNVNIGDTANGYPDTLDYAFDSTNIFLKVEVSSNGTSFETLTPRQQISSAAFAQVAGTVTGTGLSTFGGFISSASSTVIGNLNITGNSTTTNATTTFFFSTTASSTNLFANILNAGASTFTNLLLNGSSTLQNFTFQNATGTSATTTSFFSTTASSTNLFATAANIGALTVTSCTGCGGGGSSASSTLLLDNNTFSGANIFDSITRSTTTQATTTNFFSTTASSTNLFTSSLTVNGYAFTVNGTPTLNNWFDQSVKTTASPTFANLLLTASSTLQNFTFGIATGTSATTTNFFATNLWSTIINNSGLATLGNLLSTSSSTLQNFTFSNATGTSATTTNFFSTNLWSTIINNSGLATLGNLLSTGSSTLQDFTFVNATGTSATTTNFFSTTASSTNLFSTALTTGAITSGLINSQTISSAANFTGTLTATGGLTTLSNLLLTGSSTLQNFTALNSTSTNATTTNFFSTTASSTNLFATALTAGNSTLGAITSSGALNLGTNTITSGLINSQTISSATNFTGTLNVTSGLTTLSNLLLTGSSTLLNFTALNSTSTQATTTNFAVSSIASSLLKTSSGGSLLAAIAGTDFENALTFSSGVSRSLNAISVDQAFSPTWTGAHIFDNITRSTTTSATTTNLFSTTASSTNLFASSLTVNGKLFTVNGAPTLDNWFDQSVKTTASPTFANITTTTLGTFGNILATGSTTLQNFTFNNATGTSATTTNFFSTTASSTNLFSTTGNIGTLTANTANLSESGNLFYTDTRVNSYIHASTTIPKLYTANTFTAANIFDNITRSTTTSATTTNFFSTTASSTNLFASSLTVNGYAFTVNGTPTLNNWFDQSVKTTASPTFANLLLTASTTLQNFTFVNATGTSATTTNFFSTTASSTNLFSTSLNTGLITSGLINSQTISSAANFTGSVAIATTLGVTGLTTLGNASTTQIGSTGSAYFATSGGNVGIGTTNPEGNFTDSATRQLTIFDGGTGRVGLSLVSDPASDGDVIGILAFLNEDSSNTAGRGGPRILGMRGTNDNSGYLRFDVANSADAAPAMTINQSGNVGIGTTAPGGKLHVKDTTAGNNFILFAEGSSANENRKGGFRNLAVGSDDDRVGITIGGGDGSSYNRIFADNSGVLRMTSIDPASHSNGNVIGDQTSALSTKNLLGEFTSYGDALAEIVNAPLYRFNYKNHAYNDEEFVGIVTDYSPVFGKDRSEEFPNGRALNEITAIGYTFAAIKELNATTTSLALRLDGLADIATLSTPESESFVTSFFNNLFEKVKTWLADAGNGILKFFAKEIYTEKLCIKKSDGNDVCVTGDELAAILVGMSSSSSSGGSSSSPPIEESTATSTEETATSDEPAPEPAPTE